MDENKPEGYTITAKINDFNLGGIGFWETPELEDRTDYVTEEDPEELKKYIVELQKKIRDLRLEIAHLRGEVETWENSWRIWNS